MATGSLTEFIRFGYGPRPVDRVEGAGVDADRLLAQLAVNPPMPRASSADRLGLLAENRRAREIAKAGGEKSDTALKALRAGAAKDVDLWLRDAMETDAGFAERLVNFWANRLTMAWRRGPSEYLLGPYRDEAIRPHIGGRFADMLAASAWHPGMLNYLDQAVSVGPNSIYGLEKRRGLNENFAREFLELHSMGRGYSQTDVTELARLFAGMRHDDIGALFDPDRAEPGEKLILGASYGPGKEEIARLIETVALRPETAQSVSYAMAAHFIADTPPEDLVASMAAAYLAGGSDLMPVYRVLLTHAAAAEPQHHKVRNPHEYMVASLRALGATGEDLVGKRRIKLTDPLRRMGQMAFRAPGPDGWPDTGKDWITAPWLAERLAWAEMLSRRFGEEADPAAIARHSLGAGDEETIRAAGRAEQRWEGVAVLIGAPAFMRR